MEKIIYNLNVLQETYESEFDTLSKKINNLNTASFLFESFLSKENNISEFIESDSGSSINQLGALTKTFLEKVSMILKKTVDFIKDKWANLVQSVNNKKIKSDKKVKMTPYDYLADFYQSAMKELYELTYGPTKEDRFKDFCAKFSKKKKELREEEKRHQKKCFKVVISVAAFGLMARGFMNAFYLANGNAYKYVDKADKNAEAAMKNYNLSKESASDSDTGMTIVEVQSIYKMISSEMAYYANKLVVITNAAYKEQEAICNEFLKEYERENAM